jgi:hypothetical protein
VIPQDLTDVGLMVATGPVGKAARIAGAGLAASSYSPEAEAAGKVDAAKKAGKFIASLAGDKKEIKGLPSLTALRGVTQDADAAIAEMKAARRAGLRTQPRTFMQAVEDRIAETAAKRNETPQQVL